MIYFFHGVVLLLIKLIYDLLVKKQKEKKDNKDFMLSPRYDHSKFTCVLSWCKKLNWYAFIKHNNFLKLKRKSYAVPNFFPGIFILRTADEYECSNLFLFFQ